GHDTVSTALLSHHLRRSASLAEPHLYHHIYNAPYTNYVASKIKPGPATAWQYTDSTTLQFTLRQGVKFPDGTDFNCDAVKFNIDRILNAASSPRKSELASVKSVEVKDASTVIFHLKKPAAALLAQLVDRAR